MLDWPAFLQLPGSANRNFEALCRNLIRLNYGAHGEFAALANQPGVEFHLKLQTDCSGLGKAGDWFGWQCRLFDLPPAKALGTTRRKKIEKALCTTERDLPGLTDWILWTRHPLTAGDQKWFRKLKTKLRLHLNTGDEVEGLLQGPAEMLRQTYFGELRITPAALADQRDVALARIKKKWLPDVHQMVAAEREIRRMLGEADAWQHALQLAKAVDDVQKQIDADPASGQGALASLKTPYMTFTGDMARLLREVYDALAAGDQERLAQKLASRPRGVPHSLEAYPRGLRGARLASGMSATNLLQDMQDALELLGELETCNKRSLVAVVADAGGGKTHLSAELTAANPARPAGILLYGVDLHHGKTLDDLARNFSVAGRPIQSMASLLAALDAAAQRGRCRLPIVIDGLNEAEDPREWQPLLATLQAQLAKFPSVMVIVTLRRGARKVEERWPGHGPKQEPSHSFVSDALPADTFQLEIPDFGADTAEAIRKYLAYYKITPGEQELPELLSQPLTLRIFCEVTNPERKKEVGAEAIPGSQAALFEAFIAKAAQSIVRLVPSAHRYPETEVRDALDRMGLMMWQQKRRAVDETAWRQASGDSVRPWGASLVPLLEQEGIILKMKGQGVGQSYLVPIYDAIGGFLIADALLKEHGAGFGSWLAKPEVLALIDQTKAGHHPLAEDIFTSLVTLVPRRLHRQQFWSLLSEPLRKRALIEASYLEAAYLDTPTLAELAALLGNSPGWPGALHQRLFRTRAAVNHPLNAEFLTKILTPLSVADRDLRWTEWTREKDMELHNDAVALTERWIATSKRTEADLLWARWLMWLLPSTSHILRNRATLALYWFGRGNPEGLFALAEEMATLNDPYVFERLMAANYGVAMALHTYPAQRTYRDETLPALARKTFDLMFAAGAPARTTHELTREYAHRFIELAACYHPRHFTAEELGRTKPPYQDGGRVAWASVTSFPPDASGASPFRMDFENYTLGRLTTDRDNYDFNHGGYQLVRTRVRWRVNELGWTAAKFEKVDRDIADERGGYRRMESEHFKVDRYGKKYSLIAYSEMKGWLTDQGAELRGHHDRTWDVDIDPSFPNPDWQQSIAPDDFLGQEGGTLKEWITRGPVPELKPYTRLKQIGDLPGPWIALDGYVNQQEERRGRRMFGFLRSFIVAEERAAEFQKCLAKQPLKGRWLPDKPRVIYTFTGEAPWCETYPLQHQTPMKFVVRETQVEVRRKRICHFLDGKLVHSMPLSHAGLVHFEVPWMRRAIGSYTEEEFARMVRQERIVPVIETVQDHASFTVTTPVIDFGWEGNNVNDEPVHGTSLARTIARDLNLVHLPQTHDMQTRQGERATVGTRLDIGGRTTQSWFFMRENLLRAYLARRKLRLVWALWGERELSYKNIDRAREGGDLEGFSHAGFQEVFALPEGYAGKRKGRKKP